MDLEEKQGFDFMKERVKDRPLNRRKLLRKTIITISMAVIFGLIACITFLLLEPVVSNWLYPEEEIDMIEIPQETEEMLPEDMLVDEESMLQQTEDVINSIKDEMQMDPLAYERLYQDIYSLTVGLQPAIVTVTSVSQDVDWFNDPYENKGQTTGFLLADNNQQIMILAMKDELEESEDLQVTFFNGEQAKATVQGTDAQTGLAVLAVEKNSLAAFTLESIEYITLGRSVGSQLIASPVIALGRPLGNQNSVVFGMITSTGTVLNMTDCNYQLLTTDIYGSTDASGLLVNMSGQVVGIINQDFNDEIAENLICGIGITELKSVLERMSNGLENGYLGIRGADISEEIMESMNMPKGGFVAEIVMDSPAMVAGIQSGDIIIQLGDTKISSFSDYTKAVSQCRPGDIVEIVLMRQGQQAYRKVNLDVTIGNLDG